MRTNFFENPFKEGSLQFSFANKNAATRYDKWKSHVNKFVKEKKKGVDFLVVLKGTRFLIMTEIKDFTRIDKKGKYKNGTFSSLLCDDVAKKFCNTYSALSSPSKLVEQDERDFANRVAGLSRKAVFHWELKQSLRRDVRKQQYVLMSRGLKCKIHKEKMSCIHIKVFNMVDYCAPAEWWTVKRIPIPSKKICSCHKTGIIV